MSRMNLIGAMATIAASAAPLLPITVKAQTAEAADRAAITVTAPRARTTGRNPATGAPIQTITTQSLVYIDDLDLRTKAGRDVLDVRVAAAAKEACDWLNEVYPATPLSVPASQADCRTDAIRTAQAQIKDAITRSGG